VRFFTAIEMQLLFQETGYDIVKMLPLSMLQPDQLPRNADGGFTLGKMTIGPLDDREYQDFLVYQYVVVGKKATAPPLERARTALAEDRYEQAYNIASTAVDVEEAERKYILGQTLGRIGKLDAAETMLREACACAPDRADIPGQLGVVLMAMNRGQEALPYLEQAVAADPSNYRALGAWGLALLAAGDRTRAFDKLKASLEAHFDNAALMETFVNLGESLERREEVAPLLRRFVEFYPGNTAMMVCFASVLVRLGKTDEARDKLETVLLFDSANEDARKLLEELA
jgi:tetratricopeptide (TPR) repeat protein